MKNYFIASLLAFLFVVPQSNMPAFAQTCPSVMECIGDSTSRSEWRYCNRQARRCARGLTRECRKTCREMKRDAIDACQETFTGRDRRDCKKDARAEFRDCKADICG